MCLDVAKWAENVSYTEIKEVVNEGNHAQKGVSGPLRQDGWERDHCRSDVFRSGFGWMCCLYAVLLSLLPNLSLLHFEYVTPFDHTEALHQQGHGRTLTLSAAAPALVL